MIGYLEPFDAKMKIKLHMNMDANVIRYWMFDVSNLLTKTMICKKGKNTTMSFEIILSVVDTNRTYLYRTRTSYRESAKSNSHHDRTYHNFSSVDDFDTTMGR